MLFRSSKNTKKIKKYKNTKKNKKCRYLSSNNLINMCSALSLDLDGPPEPPEPAGTGLTPASWTGLPTTGDGEKPMNIFPNTFNSGTDPDLGPPTRIGGEGTGMGIGDGKGVGCLADFSNFLCLGSLEMHAQSSQLSDSSSGEGTGLTRSSARTLEGQE